MLTHPDQMARTREQENDDPIFETVSQALWVAYAVEFFKASPKSNMQTLLRLAKEKDRLTGEEDINLNTLNFRGMDDEDKITECIYIRNAVDRLPEDERAYVLARYSWDYDGQRRVGMEQMESRIKWKFDRRDGKYAGRITWWIFAPYERKIIANPQLIKEKAKISQEEVYADIKKAVRYFNGFKRGAIDILWPTFEKNGTVAEKC